MYLEPQYRCFRCNGRISSTIDQQQAPQVGTLKHYQSSKLEQLSADLNWIACTFVFDANTNLQCFDPVFSESRRLRLAIESGIKIVYALYGTLIFTLVLNMLLGL